MFAATEDGATRHRQRPSMSSVTAPSRCAATARKTFRHARASPRQPYVATAPQPARMDQLERIRLLAHATSELLESETNGSLALGVAELDCEPIVITAMGCSVLVAVGRRSPMLMALSSLNRDGRFGPRALAEGCDRTLRTVYGLATSSHRRLPSQTPQTQDGFVNGSTDGRPRRAQRPRARTLDANARDRSAQRNARRPARRVHRPPVAARNP